MRTSSLTKYDDAYNDIQEALKCQSGSPRFLYYRARIQRFRGHFEEALLDTQEVLKRIPDHSGALRLLEETDLAGTQDLQDIRTSTK